MNGCVTTLSMENGKCLDVDVLSKVCHDCPRIGREMIILRELSSNKSMLESAK